jgi:hypothetical protein
MMGLGGKKGNNLRLIFRFIRETSLLFYIVRKNSVPIFICFHTFLNLQKGFPVLAVFRPHNLNLF